MKKTNCIIADDEPLAREVIASHVAKIEELHLVATCSTGLEVFNSLLSKPTDLLFLDIQMPELTGIELLRTLSNPPAVIITTAFREFAIEGYELNVVDYLLKPVSFGRFLKAINKFRSIGTPPQETAVGREDFIYIKSDKKMVRVVLKDLVYIEGLKDYVRVHTTGGAVITYQTLTYFEEKLSGERFIRVHRSFIVSLGHISAYTASHLELGKTIIPIGTSYARLVSAKLTV